LCEQCATGTSKRLEDENKSLRERVEALEQESCELRVKVKAMEKVSFFCFVLSPFEYALAPCLCLFVYFGMLT
jgi:hypothetical protein